MKMKTHLLLIAFCFLGISLYGQKEITSQPLTKAMAKSFVVAVQADPELPSDGRLVILTDKLCESQDCASVFEGLPVDVYLREELFMRNLNSYYVLFKVEDVEGGEKWQLHFAYLINGGKASIPGTVTGNY